MSTTNILINTISDVYDELCKAKAFIADVRGSILSCIDANEEHRDFNLTEEVGIYAQKLPDLKFLSGKLETVKNGIRMICSGEISMIDGFNKISEYLDMVDAPLCCFNPENFDEAYSTFYNDSNACNCSPAEDDEVCECKCKVTDCECNCESESCECQCDCCEDSLEENDFAEVNIYISGSREAVESAIKNIF